MKWRITVFTRDKDPAGRETILFAASGEDREEVKAAATRWREMHPRAKIYLRDPGGRVEEWV